MASSDDHNRIEDLKKSLYSRDTPDIRTRRKFRVSPTENTVETSWQKASEDSVAPERLNTEYKDHSMSFLVKLLIISFVFCVIAVGFGAYLFFNGANLISGDNIEITVRGPVSVPGGAPVSFDIKVTNNNNVDLQGVDLSIDFPAGAVDPSDPSRELKIYREFIGDIPAGDSATKTVGAILYGEENLQKQLVIGATYKIKGSTALFTKDRQYDVLINSSPIFLTIDSFDETTSGQEFDIKVNLKSNSQDTLKNVILKASYPFGYSYTSSDVEPSADKATWKIGDIPPGGERTIKIKGSLQGEDSETRVFRFAAGAQSPSNPQEIGTRYMSAEHSMAIEKPFMSIAIGINGDDDPGDHVSSFGRNERVSITWFNNLPTAISNAVIRAKLSGSAYDKGSIQPDQGYFNSSQDEIVWDQKSVSDLASIGAGESGTVTFTFSPKDKGSSSDPVVNPAVGVSVSVSGKRSEGSGVPEQLASVVSRTTRVSSQVNLTGRVIRTIGPFANTGPVPPRAEQETTYTVVWTVDNTSNAVSGARVTATLPPYVKWLDKTSPSSDAISYDENSGTVTWDIGTIGTHTLNSTRRREAYFQVSFEPGVNQINQSPTLVNQATLVARDSFTGEQLQSVQDYVTTRFSTDPNYQEGQATVVK